MRYGYIDEATSLALLFNQDLNIIFDSLVDKYLAALKTEQEDITGKDRTDERIELDFGQQVPVSVDSAVPSKLSGSL